MEPEDPLARFEHDHALVARHVARLRDDLAAARSDAALTPDFVPALFALTEELVEHFDREEEGLFPFIARNLPDLKDAVAELVAAHDRLCGVATRLISAEQRDASLEQAHALFQRFEAAYVDHEDRERALLSTVAVRLDSGRRDELRELLRGI